MVKRKGIYELNKSLNYISKRYLNNFSVVTLGKLDKNFKFENNINHIHFNPSNNLHFLNEIYNLCDFFCVLQLKTREIPC